MIKELIEHLMKKKLRENENRERVCRKYLLLQVLGASRRCWARASPQNKHEGSGLYRYLEDLYSV